MQIKNRKGQWSLLKDSYIYNRFGKTPFYIRQSRITQKKLLYLNKIVERKVLGTSKENTLQRSLEFKSAINKSNYSQLNNVWKYRDENLSLSFLLESIIQYKTLLKNSNNKKYNNRNFESKIKVIRLSRKFKDEFINKQELKYFYNLQSSQYQLPFNKLERRLDVILFRLGWVSSLKESKYLIKKGKVLIKDSKLDWKRVNGNYKNYYLKVGSLIKLESSYSKSKNLYLNKKYNIEKPFWFKCIDDYAILWYNPSISYLPWRLKLKNVN